MRPAAALVFMALLNADGRAAETPKDLGLKESLQIGLVPLEVTVWPKEGSDGVCTGLTLDDFTLRVDRKPLPIYAVDALGVNEELYLRDAAPAPDAPSTRDAPRATGMSFVFYFDLRHLDVFHQWFSACPLTKALALDEARTFVDESFHDGDRLMLVTSSGWPVIHEGWLTTKTAAHAALDRLTRNPQFISPGGAQPLHYNAWVAGLESLFTALGRYPGRKDVVYLGDDFFFGQVAVRMAQIAARAQANGVVMSAVDLLSTCRRVYGPPCVPTGGGLLCTPFRDPIALNPLSRDTGGALFLTHRITQAASELRAMRSCRYLVSFRKAPDKGKRPPQISLDLREGLRKELTLFAPTSYETAATAPSKREADQALFLLPGFARGIAAEVTLWPYRPADKRDRWSVFAVARLDRTDTGPLPDGLSEIKVNVLLHRRSTIYGEYTKRIAGADLAAFASKGGTGILLFPLEGVPPGDATVDLTVTANVEDVSANVSRSATIPKPPGAGEAGPWYLATQVDRMGQSAVLAPAFDDVVTPDEFVSFVGYGCLGKGGADQHYVGSLLPAAGGDPVALPMQWLKRPDTTTRGCGWLAGKVDTPLAPGQWTFRPPANRSGRAASPEVSFTVHGGRD